ncbi:PilZ domain-containing protein [Myxococcota bacterium]
MPESSITPGRQRRVDIRIKVNLKYPDRQTFIDRFCQNISRTGIFIRASDPAPVGSRIHFEYTLLDDSRILRGVGIVRWARRPGDSQEPETPPGMGLEFIDLDPQTDELINQIVAQFGEGKRAPRRAKRDAQPPPPPLSPSKPAKRLDEAELDPEEENALDALLGGESPSTPPTPPPLPGQTIAEQPVLDTPTVDEDKVVSASDETGEEAGVSAHGEAEQDAAISVFEEAGEDTTSVDDEGALPAEPDEEEVQVSVSEAAEKAPVAPSMLDELEQTPVTAPTEGRYAPLNMLDELEPDDEADAAVSMLDEAEDAPVAEPDDEADAAVSMLDEAEEAPVAEPDDEADAAVSMLDEAEEAPVAEPDDEADAAVSMLDEAEEAPVAEPDDEADAAVSMLDAPEEAPVAEPDDEADAAVTMLDEAEEALVAEPDDEADAAVTMLDEAEEAPIAEPDDEADAAVTMLDEAEEVIEEDAAIGGLGEKETPADTQAPWVFDLTGATLVATPARDPASIEAHKVPSRLVAQGGALQADDAGMQVTGLLTWIGATRPSAYALVAARRLGITLSQEGGQTVMTLEDATVPVWDAVDALIDKLVEPISAAPPTDVTVVVPTSASDTALEMLRDRLIVDGVERVHLMTDAAAALSASDMTLATDQLALVVHVCVGETRVALVRGPDEVIASHCAPDLGLSDIDRALAERATVAFLREHELDVDDDPSLKDHLVKQITVNRRETAADQDWEITVAGAPVTVEPPTLGEWLAPLNERVALMCEAALAGQAQAIHAIVITAEEALWLGLVDALAALIGVRPTLLEHGYDEQLRAVVAKSQK